MAVAVIKQVAPKRLGVRKIERRFILRVQREKGVVGRYVGGGQIGLESSTIPGQSLRDAGVRQPGSAQQTSGGRSAQRRSDGSDLLFPITGDVELGIECSLSSG